MTSTTRSTKCFDLADTVRAWAAGPGRQAQGPRRGPRHRRRPARGGQRPRPRLDRAPRRQRLQEARRRRLHRRHPAREAADLGQRRLAWARECPARTTPRPACRPIAGPAGPRRPVGTVDPRRTDAWHERRTRRPVRRGRRPAATLPGRHRRLDAVRGSRRRPRLEDGPRPGSKRCSPRRRTTRTSPLDPAGRGAVRAGVHPARRRSSSSGSLDRHVQDGLADLGRGVGRTRRTTPAAYGWCSEVLLAWTTCPG